MTSPEEMNAQDRQIEELLAAHADAMHTPPAGLEVFKHQLDRYSLTPQQTDEAVELLDLAQALREALGPIEPSAAFTARLKNELVGEQPMTLLVRWRKLPAHYQLAAKLGGLTLTAGIAVLAVSRALVVLDTLHRRNQPDTEKGLSPAST